MVGGNLFSGGYMLTALWMTTKEVLLGFFFAIAIGFSLGVLVGDTTFGERAVLPYLVAIDTMPKVAFAPLFLAWLGFGIASKVALAAFIATFPIVVGTAAGLHAADENARMLFKTMGASRWQTLFKMKIPTGPAADLHRAEDRRRRRDGRRDHRRVPRRRQGVRRADPRRCLAVANAAGLLADPLPEPARLRDLLAGRLRRAQAGLLAPLGGLRNYGSVEHDQSNGAVGGREARPR